MDQISLNKNRFLFLAGVIAILNPLLPGLIVGLYMISQSSLRREGIAITLFSIAWGAIALTLVSRLGPSLPSL